MKYIARLTFRINRKFNAEKTVFDEQLRMIEAENRNVAFEYAKAIGKKENEMLCGGNSEVHWEFIDISELWELEEKENGTLLYTFTKCMKKEKDYITFVKGRAQSIAGSFQQKENIPLLPREESQRNIIYAR